MNIELKEIDQDWATGATDYIFDVDGEEVVIRDSEGWLSNAAEVSLEVYMKIVAILKEMNDYDYKVAYRARTMECTI